MPSQRDAEGIEAKYLHQAINLNNARVLEIGCGDGRLTWLYANLVQRIAGIDPSAEDIAVALKDCPPALSSRLSFAQARAETLPFANKSFERVILAWTL